MKAMLLAAGAGARLRPFTDHVPKCMIPVGGKPILERTIEHLRRYGVTELVINVCTLPQVIMDYFGDGERWGVHIIYSVEERPLGTAGGVKNAEWFFEAPPRPPNFGGRSSPQGAPDLREGSSPQSAPDPGEGGSSQEPALSSPKGWGAETHVGSLSSGDDSSPQNWGAEGGDPFLIWYGDNLSRCDLGRLIARHAAKGSVATIALHHREDVSQSGIVDLDSDDRIVRFLEKPRPEQVFSHWVNAGIYVLDPCVLDYLPDSATSDFARDVFPAMLHAGQPLYGYPLAADEGLWWIDRPEDLTRVQAAWEEQP